MTGSGPRAPTAVSVGPLAGKVALVTGASDGIGKGLALALAARGMHVGLAARRLPELEAVAAECRSHGVRAIAVATDVGIQSDCERFVREASAALGKVDVLVNNAGIGMWARFDEVQDLSIYERLMRVNYLGSVWTTHAALPALFASKGLVVAISSLTGLTGVPTRSGYAAAKHAVQGFFDSIRIELAPKGVQICIVSPGFVATEIRARNLDAEGQARGASPRNERAGTMSIETCVARIVRAIERRERDVIMTTKAKVGRWLKLAAPRLVDRLATAAVRETNE